MPFPPRYTDFFRTTMSHTAYETCDFHFSTLPDTTLRATTCSWRCLFTALKSPPTYTRLLSREIARLRTTSPARGFQSSTTRPLWLVAPTCWRFLSLILVKEPPRNTRFLVTAIASTG